MMRKKLCIKSSSFFPRHTLHGSLGTCHIVKKTCKVFEYMPCKSPSHERARGSKLEVLTGFKRVNLFLVKYLPHKFAICNKLLLNFGVSSVTVSYSTVRKLFAKSVLWWSVPIQGRDSFLISPFVGLQMSFIQTIHIKREETYWWRRRRKRRKGKVEKKHV